MWPVFILSNFCSNGPIQRALVHTKFTKRTWLNIAITTFVKRCIYIQWQTKIQIHDQKCQTIFPHPPLLYLVLLAAGFISSQIVDWVHTSQRYCQITQLVTHSNEDTVASLRKCKRGQVATEGRISDGLGHPTLYTGTCWHEWRLKRGVFLQGCFEHFVL